MQRRGESFRVQGEQAKAAVEALTRLYLLAEKQELSIDDVQLCLVELRRHAANGVETAADDEDVPVLVTRRGDLRGRTRVKAATSRPSSSTTSPSASARPAPARPIWRWAARWTRWSATRSSASCWCARRWKPAKLGFLPGDLAQKVDPYLRPLYDALYDLMGFDRVTRLFEKNLIEIAPLAYMRGRTLNNAFIILDEAQNTTPEQMKMFLTRIGFGSRAVITGDVTQIDLARHQKSGLVEVERILGTVRGIHFHHFQSDDVVRHPLVQKIVDAYDQYQSKQDEKSQA